MATRRCCAWCCRICSVMRRSSPQRAATPESKSGARKKVGRPSFSCATTVPASICASPKKCSACFSDCTARTNFPAPALASQPCRRSFNDTAGAYGPKPFQHRPKVTELRFTSRCGRRERNSRRVSVRPAREALGGLRLDARARDGSGYSQSGGNRAKALFAQRPPAQAPLLDDVPKGRASNLAAFAAARQRPASGRHYSALTRGRRSCASRCCATRLLQLPDSLALRASHL